MLRDLCRYRRFLILSVLLIINSTSLIVSVSAQYNIDRLLMIGRSALYYEDYVLSIQYFNQAITAKPFLYEPWFYRGVAKFYLEDYKSAESDCSEAIRINPYVDNLYELRALCRIYQKNYDGAVSDYTAALRQSPDNKQYWHNRTLCRINQGEDSLALADLDTINRRWPRYAPGFSMRAEVYLNLKDTAAAEKALDSALTIDPYDGSNWMVKGGMAMSKELWKEGEAYLDKAIHLMPKVVNNYINRALCRYKQNNLRGTMSDYDMAVDLDPDNFIAHYNRGLLRAEVGDDNRAITDFDFVLSLEPDNLMALFNRALLLDRTGDLRGAIRDYSRVISVFPNFWTGLHYRADCYRRLGYTKQAELDEFRIMKSHYDKLQGRRQAMTSRQKEMRKKNETDMEKYNQLVIADDEEKSGQLYKNDYRGRVQNRDVSLNYQPLFEISFERMESAVKRDVPFDIQIEKFNSLIAPLHASINGRAVILTSAVTARYMHLLDSLSSMSRPLTSEEHMVRSIVFAMLQDYSSAIDEATLTLSAGVSDWQSLSLWHRAVCREKRQEVEKLNKYMDETLQLADKETIDDFDQAIRLDRGNPYLLFNRATVYARMKEYSKARTDYDAAIRLDPLLAEAYYNRGLLQIQQRDTVNAVSDLSKAGELGLYGAYSVIKKYRK